MQSERMVVEKNEEEKDAKKGRGFEPSGEEVPPNRFPARAEGLISSLGPYFYPRSLVLKPGPVFQSCETSNQVELVSLQQRIAKSPLS